MSLDSIEYLGFLALVLPLFWAVPVQARWLLLLSASVAFHASFGAPLSLVAFVVLLVANFYLAQWIHRAGTERLRSALFWSGVLLDVGVLVSGRYGAGLAGQMGLADHSIGGVMATVGISYCVLTTIAYLADVYARGGVPESHLGYFALHLWFFPKLIQGPIERPELIAELRTARRFDYEEWRGALLMIAGGLFKKLVVANRFGIYVDRVYGDVRAHTGLDLIVATYMYALQVYFDFSGYTDIALGSARLFGIPLTPNFNSPYLARSIAEFWRRWHISFSRWILDYIFLPLQMRWRSLKNLGTASALLVTFLISGLWHGVSWPFVIWGLLHGSYLAASIYYRPFQTKIYARLGIRRAAWLPIWQQAVTFHLVCLAWIFFRAGSLSDAWYLLTHLFVGLSQGAPLLHYRPTQLAVLAFAAAILLAVKAIRPRPELEGYLFSRPLAVRWAFYYAMLISILLLGDRPHAPFIYARF